MRWNHSSMSSLASFLSLTVKGHVHAVMHGQLRKPQHTYVTRGIQGHPYWCRQKSRTVCRRNVQLMPTLFLKLKMMATGKRQSRRFQRHHSGLTTPRQETPSNIYKWFILPQTGVIGLYFCRRLYVSMFVTFYAVIFKRWTLWVYNCYYGNRVLHEIDTQGHSFCRTTRGSTSPCNIAGLISEVSKELATQISKNCRRRQPQSHLMPLQEEPPRLSVYAETLLNGLHLCRW